MLEKMKRQSPPKDSWLAFTFRCLAALVYLLISIAAGHYFDVLDSSISVRCVAVVTFVSGFVAAFMWLMLWMKRADEYQRLMNYRNLVSAMMTAMISFITIHIFYGFYRVGSAGWPVMAMPAFAIFCAVIGSRPKKS